MTATIHNTPRGTIRISDAQRQRWREVAGLGGTGPASGLSKAKRRQGARPGGDRSATVGPAPPTNPHPAAAPAPASSAYWGAALRNQRQWLREATTDAKRRRCRKEIRRIVGKLKALQRQ